MDTKLLKKVKVNREEIIREFPPFIINSIIKNFKTRQRSFSKDSKKKELPSSETWFSNFARNRLKLKRLLRESREPIDWESRSWGAFFSYQKEKLKQRTDETFAWKNLEYRMLEKMNNHDFPIEMGALWSYVFLVQKRKLKRMLKAPKPPSRKKVTNQRFIYLQQKKLRKRYTRLEPKDHGWMLCFEAQRRKLIDLVKNDWERKFRYQAQKLKKRLNNTHEDFDNL